MKNELIYLSERWQKGKWLFILIVCVLCMPSISARNQQNNADSTETIICKGLVKDAANGTSLPFASVAVEESNIATVTNTNGEFTLKVPGSMKDKNLVVVLLGYKNKAFPISAFTNEYKRLNLEISEIQLPEINVIFKDAESLMKAVFERKGENYVNDPTFMTAFYRETIKKRRTYVSLLESVVDVHKFPYTSDKMDVAALYKVRKETDYSKLDTLVFKLMGGPYNTLYMDVMKNPDFVFTDNMFENYIFGFDRSTMINNRIVYVLDFKQRPGVKEPLYNGKLYIDANTLALINAVFDIDLSDKEKASQLFIRRKPLNAKIEVTKANYRMNYIVRNGKWYLGYSRIELNVKVDWKRRLFNSYYESVMEMAVTDWMKDNGEKWDRAGDRLKPNVIIADTDKGFADSDFWGKENVIEPEKSIQSAIKKIQKKLKSRD